MLALVIVVIITLLYMLYSIKILAEYERAVIFRLGRMIPLAKGPGIIFVFGPIDRMVSVSLRQEALEVPSQETITRDNFLVKVNAVVFLRVIDPNKAVIAVENYKYQTSQFAQTTIRSVLSEVDLQEVLAHREKINLQLQSIIDQRIDPWGVKITNVEIKQVDPAAVKNGQLILEGDLMPTINRKLDLILAKLSIEFPGVLERKA